MVLSAVAAVVLGRAFKVVDKVFLRDPPFYTYRFNVNVATLTFAGGCAVAAALYALATRSRPDRDDDR